MESPTVSLGKLRGLQQCALSNGTFAMLAIDHRQNLRRELCPGAPETVTAAELEAFKVAVILGLGPWTSAILVDPEIGLGPAIASGSLPGTTGLIVAIEATGYEGRSTRRESRFLDGWTVEKARRIGAAGVKLLVYYHPDAENAADQERLVAAAVADARRFDIPLWLEPLSFSLDANRSLDAAERQRVIVETARRLTALGPDMLKAEFPGDRTVPDEAVWRAACDELTAASRVPWVLLSGGVDHDAFVVQARVACQAGASGVLAGRSTWAEAATLGPDDRVAFLATTARTRMDELTAACRAYGRPWQVASTARPASVAEGWYRAY